MMLIVQKQNSLSLHTFTLKRTIIGPPNYIITLAKANCTKTYEEDCTNSYELAIK